VPDLSFLIKKRVIGNACNTYGKKRGEKGFCWGNLRDGNHLENVGVGGRIILKWIFRK
jgi:hypothetical protein